LVKLLVEVRYSIEVKCQILKCFGSLFISRFNYLNYHYCFIKVGGGIILAGKGVGKGVIHGDGQAVLTGLGDGVVSVGNGLLKGGESVATGVGDGVFAVGKGLFSGVKSIGMGLGGAVTGKKSNNKPQRRRRT
jgi:hypothetical protein